MRVAAIYDIHGNLPALEKVLREIRAAGVDHVVVGGDVIPGPMPKESLQSLLDFPVPTQFIYGNGEVAVLEVMEGRSAIAAMTTRMATAASRLMGSLAVRRWQLAGFYGNLRRALSGSSSSHTRS